jgi:hypothetical protein
MVFHVPLRSEFQAENANFGTRVPTFGCKTLCIIGWTPSVKPSSKPKTSLPNGPGDGKVLPNRHARQCGAPGTGVPVSWAPYKWNGVKRVIEHLDPDPKSSSMVLRPDSANCG